MSLRGTSVLQFTYPIGSNNDPSDKKGLTHFLEHCVLKAKMNTSNLIGVCQKYGATVNAYTSHEELRIEIKVLSNYAHSLISEYSIFLENCEHLKIDDLFIENEKLIIINEMETKDELNVHDVLGNEILGYESTVSTITKDDLKNYLKIFQLLRPKIRISEIKSENKALINKIIQTYTKDKFISLNSVIINSFSLIIYQMYCSLIHRVPDILSIGYKNYIKYDEEILSFTKKVSISEVDDFIKCNHEWFKKKYKNIYDLDTLLKQLISNIEEYIDLVITEEHIEEIEIVKLSKINNINYCITSPHNNYHFAAISICPNDLIRKNILNVTKALGSYFKSLKDDVNVNVNYEIGLISFYLSGNEDSILFLLKKLINIDSKLINYFGNSSKRSHHILEQIHLDILHNGSTELELQEIKETLEINGIGYLSIVTSIDKVNILEQILRENKKNTIPKIKENNLITHIKKYSSENEYIQIWEGPTYFSEDKYISHILWSILDGTTGELYKKMSLENSYFYSFKFFPRELYDAGYMILYVFTRNKKYKDVVGALFSDLLKDIYLKLTDEELIIIKKKLILAQKNSNKGDKIYINLSSFILFEDNLGSFFNYEQKINSLTLNELKNFIKKLIENNSMILT
ncbi:insulinase family protein [Lysinibacillus xylanilyticus]|uniref:insulinase family protein n=1 Tax=Lysinibacillus xylanilyticus TaxID=582475 RepID=UPI003811A34A